MTRSLLLCTFWFVLAIVIYTLVALGKVHISGVSMVLIGIAGIAGLAGIVASVAPKRRRI